MRRGFWLEPISTPASCVCAALSVGCASERATPVAVPEPAPAMPHHAPGIAVDPTLSLPKASETGSAEHGVVVLVEPVDTRSARRVVATFFAAVVDESLDDLAQLSEPGASTKTSPASRTKRPLVAFWQRRFERLDYRALATEVFYRESEMEVHSARDANAVGLSRSVPVPLKGAEVLVRTPIVGSSSSRFFGSDLLFLLRPTPAGYKIAEIIEDFRLP